MTEKQTKRILGISIIVIVLLLLIVLAANAVYIIEEQEQAVVVTFGEPTVVSAPGPHFKIPFIQDVKIVSMVVNGLSIGYEGAGDDSVYNESMMITSDFNFVNVDFFLEYKVSQPDLYLFASSDPVAILKNLALSYIRDTVGLYGVDEVITTGKNEIQAEIKEKLTNRLEQEAIGLQLVNITIQDSEPPTEEVTDAFKNVETAKQGKETAINTARKYESEQLPAARAQEDAILKDADAQKEARINAAIGQVAVFNGMYEEYQKNPLMTRQRMFFETMEEVLPGLKVVIDSGDGSTTKLLPLESFTGDPVVSADATGRSYDAGTEGGSDYE
jgi:membrane protease subunit HflK